MRAHFRFYAGLNAFLPAGCQQATFAHVFDGRVSLKDMVETLGVPHTQVDLLLVNGASLDWSYLVRDGDQISVYPHFASIDVSPLTRVRPPPLREPRFVLDTHLGKLAAYLRMLGFDVLYRNDYPDDELAQISSREERILLTRDVGLLKRAIVEHGHYVSATDPQAQLLEVLRRYDLFAAITPFRRCIRCNGALQPVDKAEIDQRLPPHTLQYYDEFHLCQACGQIYWRGSHYARMQSFIAHVCASRRPDLSHFAIPSTKHIDNRP